MSYAVACLGLTGAAFVARAADGSLHTLSAGPPEHATGVWADLYLSAPVAEAARQGTVMVVDDILDEGHRWVAVRELFASVGVRSARAFPVRAHGVPFGALVACAAEPWGQQRSSGTGQTLADLAALVISQGPAEYRQEMAVEQIVGLLESQVAVNQAYGMLAEAGDVTIEAAAAILAGYAASCRASQPEVAGWLVADATRIATVHAGPHPAGDDAPSFGAPRS